MCFPCAAGGIPGRWQPLSSEALRKQQAEKPPDPAEARRGRDADANACPRPGPAQELIKSFVESY